MSPRSLSVPASVALALFLTACGGGGGGSSADVRPGPQDAPTPVGVPNSFLTFPNPQVQADGTVQTLAIEYAQAYYRAVDPTNAKDTLAKWKAANGWDTGTGQQFTVVFGDKRDLGYGRRMNVRSNPDGTLSFWVENYLIQAGPDYVYSPLNLQAAIVRDPKWIVGVNAIEWSPGPAGGVPFAKYYNFNGTTGDRNVAVDLDNHGDKSMPGPCISCHGGRGDALTPVDASGNKRFNLVQNSPSHVRGDVTAKLHPFEAGVFDFATNAGFSRAEQEASIKAINKLILCTYPLAVPSSAPEDACRRPATNEDYQGPAADIIKNAYGGDGLPSATFNDTLVPQSWLVNGQSSLYTNVVATSCRTCHGMRGLAPQSDIDFNTYEKFKSYADRIKVHVFDRGNMPLAKIVYDAFWGDPTRPRMLADFVQAQGFPVPRDANGNPVQPGRPVANVGPDRLLAPGATRLAGGNSPFATAFAWTLVSGGNGAALTDSTTSTPLFTATVPGTYVVQLVVSNGTLQSAPAQQTLVVASGLAPAPSAVRFADIKAVMQENNRCTQCHSPTPGSSTQPHPPVFYTNEDRNGDGAVDATDDAWFYAEVRSRINFTDMGASPLLRKPSNNHHNGGLIAGFDTSKPPGDPARALYDRFAAWVLNGAPQ